jgi:UDP-N-acetylmuramate--alanine ligase
LLAVSEHELTHASQEVASVEQNASATEPLLDPTRWGFAGYSGGLDGLGNTHFIGVGGAGMSVLAEMLHEDGIEVDGSDVLASTKTERLQTLGIPVEIGQRRENVDNVDTVVWSSAIKQQNPELQAAYQQGKRLVHRSDILALLLSNHIGVTVAGAHGKTTTSALIAHILTHAGTGELADPSYAVGGTIQGPTGSLDGGHAGKGSVLVAEADESDGSFCKYQPAIAVITNVEADHLDHYGDAQHFRAAFVEHAHHASEHVVICADDEGALAVLRAMDPEAARHAVAYSTQDQDSLGDVNGAHVARIQSESEQSESGEERFTLHLPADMLPDGRDADVRVTLQIPGLHNARNASAAIITCTLLGLDPQQAADAAQSFLGADRRFQLRGVVGGVSVVDDYSHHPTEIAALLDAARRRYPNSTLRVLFQPHLFSRTEFFTQAFAESLAKADDVMVTGIFPARERQEDFPQITESVIVQAAEQLPHQPEHGWIHAVEDMNQAAMMLAMRANPGDVLFTVGAGDVTQVVPVILHALEARGQGSQELNDQISHKHTQDKRL